MNIYVASSWRNKKHPEIVKLLEDLGYSVYDYRNPPNKTGFTWAQVLPNWMNATPQEFRDMLDNPLTEAAFNSDFNELDAADLCVLLLPCGRSAHLEAGYAVGCGRNLIILQEESCEPELMYKMANYLCIDREELVEAVKLCLG